MTPSNDISALPDKLAHPIRLVALDVDGVLTDGRLRYAAQPEQDGDKVFHVRDGLGLKLIMQAGVEVALITGRISPAVDRRAQELGIRHVIQGREDKQVALKALMAELALQPDEVCYCGDDLPDLGAILYAGLGVTVSDAPDYIRQRADLVTRTPGGHGAVRELCEWLLNARGVWQDIIDAHERL
ncbi:KdsC family phosphatase [Kushneria marisflavi]|uniref:3-deoxy-D-manno-octulosonate 8-phosphate phosphatase KdsC n=1 Tax=Kushneria marisflavi TaxID=157779 RepID=A0A240URW1_9GAMM|nr:HAD hydrolase family protein [Kushneria marisflavi]ART64247.1 phenylphosphate carboxylase subunit delta [Kushneria marisflavi]RKD76709.1 3-deoxy-D-manno-octulosonate 8-phosphate phosphatase (KDO 8-P phosphatase) [Kushneria marisflavi]